ncbi:LacI family DNA-binding transcriptional regulator [Microbacterium sp. NPDC077663]|uniref:LacI family DNA-binding transcriptional regulator n=1 Tax=Microbacterium sp. NPDC077663 TaxID=3364189 RepID=UPI0037C871BF
MTATLHDVAKAAGVSPMTVSNVVNGHPNVRPATRDRVLEAISRLDYRVNVAARRLRQGRTGIIGLAVPEIDRPYFGHLAARVIQIAGEHGYRVAIEQTASSRDQELAAITLSQNLMYDGLILTTVALGDADADLLRVDYPIVALGERLFDSPIAHVMMPNVAAAQAAVAHLLERGCRRVGFIGGRSDQVDMLSQRFAGYRAALRAAGIDVDEELIVDAGALDMRAGAEAVTTLRDRNVPFDGLFCVTDTVAIGALHALHDTELRVPQDIKVIGFDDVPESEFTNPSLSTVDPDHEFIARRAVELLVTQISGTVRPKATEETSSFRIVPRRSTE